jgi:D-glycero-alpha-D-manno-heptose 1-phosphate guanylyltransferase
VALAPPEAIVLVGGFGTRLRDVVADLPKPLAPVSGRPFIAYLLDGLAAGGLRHAVLATGYFAETVERVLGNDWRGMRLSYSVEDSPLGTGGAVRRAARSAADGPLIVLNGDTYLEFDPIDFVRTMVRSDAELGVALAAVPEVGRYGAVTMEGERVVAFGEKTGQGPGLINAGVYFLSREAVLRLPNRETFSLEREVLMPAAAAGTLCGYTRTARFLDIGIPEDYALAQTLAQDWRVGS